MCYIETTSDGVVTWGADSSAYKRALSGASRLYAVWPGRWSSHLFAIDDIDQYARAWGIVHDEKRTGLAEHEHQVQWSVSPYEDKSNGTYISIDVQLHCGCAIRDLKTFSSQMRQQKGWDIATTAGWGSSGSESTGYTYSLRARRKSLTD
ncbi:hypothetical protein AB0H34_03100 [Saccharopolyspora shandongensis]|uniref:hypothetical protein n=1 Tax=Saccharopolyspora shandongensis TaxID=418495 RepID=UPI0033F94EC7